MVVKLYVCFVAPVMAVPPSFEAVVLLYHWYFGFVPSVAMVSATIFPMDVFVRGSTAVVIFTLPPSVTVSFPIFDH